MTGTVKSSGASLPTKALSLKQPWVWAVLNGKDIENRKWNTYFRGSFWIHASGTMSRRYYLEAKEFIEERGLVVPAPSELPRSGIIGRATLDWVIPKMANPSRKWHMSDQYGFVLTNIVEVPFTPCLGALNFWDVPKEVLDKLCQY